MARDNRVPLSKNSDNQKWSFNGFVKPCSKFWKRYFNKKLRRSHHSTFKKTNWWYWY